MRQVGLVQWQPSAENSFKVNFDREVFGEEQEAGIGVVIRDNEGHVLVALSEKVRLPASVEVLEMLANEEWLRSQGNLVLAGSVLKGMRS